MWSTSMCLTRGQLLLRFFEWWSPPNKVGKKRSNELADSANADIAESE